MNKDGVKLIPVMVGNEVYNTDGLLGTRRDAMHLWFQFSRWHGEFADNIYNDWVAGVADALWFPWVFYQRDFLPKIEFVGIWWKENPIDDLDILADLV